MYNMLIEIAYYSVSGKMKVLKPGLMSYPYFVTLLRGLIFSIGHKVLILGVLCANESALNMVCGNAALMNAGVALIV